MLHFISPVIMTHSSIYHRSLVLPIRVNIYNTSFEYRQLSYFKHPALENVNNKVVSLWKWYEQLTGLDEVQASQNKVISVQDRFAIAQDKRREVNMELSDVKSKIRDLQEELSTTGRGDDKFIMLITKVHSLYKDEVRITEKFHLYDREERELFNTLTNAIKDSQMKEKIQSNKTKYLSIIGSVVGAVIGILGTSLNSRSKNNKFKNMMIKITEENRKEFELVLKKLEITTNMFEIIDTNLNKISHDVTGVKFLINSPDTKISNVDEYISKDQHDEVTKFDESSTYWKYGIYAFSAYILLKVLF